MSVHNGVRHSSPCLVFAEWGLFVYTLLFSANRLVICIHLLFWNNNFVIDDTCDCHRDHL